MSGRREPLSKALAERPYAKSEDLRKATSETRRTATTIRKHLQSIGGLLSDADRDALARAAGILESLGAASQKAAAAKKREEEEAERLRQSRLAEAMATLKERYPAADWREALALAVGIGKARGRFPEYSERDVRDHMAWISRNMDSPHIRPKESLISSIEQGLKETFDGLAWSAATRSGPIAEILEPAFPKIDASLAQVRSSGLADEVSAFMVAMEMERSASRAPKE